MSGSTTVQYSLNWSNHTDHVRKAFETLLSKNEFVDVTLSCEGRKLGAHKVLLSACSVYFHDLFRDNPCQHPIIILKDVKYKILEDILHFVYNGEVSVCTEDFDSFLNTAELLQISGLTNVQIKGDKAVETRPSVKRKSEENPKSEPQAKRCTEETSPCVEPEVVEEMEEFTYAKVEVADSLEDDPCQKEDDAVYSDTIQEQPEFQDLYVEDKTTITVTSDAFTKWHAEGPVTCKICNKNFVHPYSLRQHMPVHAGNTQCPVCHVVLSRKYHLKLHMKARHNVAT